MSMQILTNIANLSEEYINIKKEAEDIVGQEIIVDEDRKLRTPLSREAERAFMGLFPIAESLAINIAQLCTNPELGDECNMAIVKIIELLEGKTHFYNDIEKIHLLSRNCL